MSNSTEDVLDVVTSNSRFPGPLEVASEATMPPPGWMVTPIIVVIICILGIIGSILCILVLSRKDMRSTYVCNLRGLAYSDLLLLIIGALRTLDKITEIPRWMTTGNLYTKDVLFFLVWICKLFLKYKTTEYHLTYLTHYFKNFNLKNNFCR